MILTSPPNHTDRQRSSSRKAAGLIKVCAVTAALAYPAFILQAVAGSAEVRVEAVRINGSVIVGAWMPTQEAGKVVVRTPIRQEILGVDDLLSLRFTNHAEKPQENDWPTTIVCRDGSILPTQIVDGDAARVVLRTPFAERLSLPVEQVRVVRWRRNAPLCRDVDELLSTRSPGKDVLVVLQEDKPHTVEGTLESLSAQGGQFRFRDRSLQFDATNACVVSLAGGSQVEPAAVVCVMNEDYHLAGQIAAATEETILLEGVAGRTVLPIAEVQELRFNSSRVVYLSDLKPNEVRQQGFFDVPWPTRFDQAVGNQPLSMKGRRFSKGIGVHARSEITYQLDGAYMSLSATIGIDDRVRPGGNVVFRLEADGKEVFNSGPITGRDDPRNIDVRLDRSRTLRLIVEEGEELDLADHADWAEARLIRR